MHLSIITLCVKDNTDNSHISFAHLCCLLHPSLVSYIILFFMKTLIHPMNELLHILNVVAAF